MRDWVVGELSPRSLTYQVPGSIADCEHCYESLDRKKLQMFILCILLNLWLKLLVDHTILPAGSSCILKVETLRAHLPILRRC